MNTNFLHVTNGREVMLDYATISDSQIRLKKKMVEMSLFWSEEEKNYQIQISMPWGNVYTLESYANWDEAIKRYEEVVRKLNKGSAIIEMDASFSIVEK